MDDGDRYREERTLGRENPWGLQIPGNRSRTANGGQPGEGRQSQARARNSLIRPAQEGSVDEQGRPA